MKKLPFWRRQNKQAARVAAPDSIHRAREEKKVGTTLTSPTPGVISIKLNIEIDPNDVMQNPRQRN